MTVAPPPCSAETWEIAEQLREALSRRAPVRITGAGTWLTANRPVRASTTLSVAALTGIAEYEPGDLTLTARAGTSLDEIGRVTAGHGQWLTLDPFGSDAGTIGATVATASAGPLAQAFGTPRDLVLGVEFVTGKGAVVRGGGRVVKNVAGFDLTRLCTGSWGTLGVITEVTVRLRARPEVDETLVAAIDDRTFSRNISSWRRSAPFVPLALELLDARLAGRVGLHDGPVLLARIGGNESAVRAQRSSLRELAGDAVVTDPAVWRVLRSAEPEAAIVVRFSARASEFAAVYADAREIAAAGDAYVHATPARGIARVVIPLDAHDHARAVELSSLALDRPVRGARICERLPADSWARVASPIADRLSRGIKQAFDPAGILNPGILGEAAP